MKDSHEVSVRGPGGLSVQSRRQRQGAPAVAGLLVLAVLGGACGSSRTAATALRVNALAYSRCMRAHGIPDFPDPDAQGGIAISAGQGSDLDPNNPQFQAAQQACQRYMPNGLHMVHGVQVGGPGGGKVASSGGSQ